MHEYETPEPFAKLLPRNKYDAELAANVHPPQWSNPTPGSEYHLVVVGAGTAGLVTAAGAAGLGGRVALVERELMGGDCLNVGCVPSKGLISSARVAATVRAAKQFGVHVPNGAHVEFEHAMQRMRRLRAQISPADSAKRFADLGVDVFFGQGAFENENTLSVTRKDGSRSELKFKKAVVATGARAAAPPIPGLDSVNYLTNENLFSLTELPKRFGVIGAGPIGSEMAQVFARFGSEVFLFEQHDHILPREDPDAAKILQRQFEKDGVRLVLESEIQIIVPCENDRIRLKTSEAGKQCEYVVDQLLVAVGRTPNIDGLGLDAVHVDFDRTGVVVNDFLQTTNSKIYAAGDICSKYKFTHAADFQARIVIQNALFSMGPFGRKKASLLVIPWVTFTSPEIAHVGMYPQDAKLAGIEIDTYIQPLKHIDRAILEGNEEGFVKIFTRQGTDKIVGATIIAENAGEIISEITLALTHDLGLAKIGSTIHAYPTQSEAVRKLGDQFNKTRLTSFSKKLLGLLMRLSVGK